MPTYPRKKPDQHLNLDQWRDRNAKELEERKSDMELALAQVTKSLKKV
jgi:hypothetical protein